jgi:hypothetical protein
MSRPSRYSADFRARPVRLVIEGRPEHDTEWGAMTSVAAKLGGLGGDGADGPGRPGRNDKPDSYRLAGTSGLRLAAEQDGC